jgi:hypothetical protein
MPADWGDAPAAMLVLCQPAKNEKDAAEDAVKGMGKDVCKEGEAIRRFVEQQRAALCGGRTPLLYFPSAPGNVTVASLIRGLPNESWWAHCNVIVEAQLWADCPPQFRRSVRFIAVSPSALGGRRTRRELEVEFDDLIGALNPDLDAVALLVKDRLRKRVLVVPRHQ